MTAHNLYAAVSIAKRHTSRYGVPLFDLVRADNPGLVDALENGEIEGRLCFSIYAIRCICQYIERDIERAIA